MRYLFITLLSLSSFAQIPSATINNLKASYITPSGTAKADNFLYNGKDYGKELSLELQAGELVLNTDSDEFRLNKLPSFITEAKSLNIEEISLNSNGETIELISKRIDFTDQEDNEKYLTGLNVKCETTQSNFVSEVLDLCLNQKLTFYLPFVKGLNINNINIWGNNNKLNFSFKNGVWIKGYGALFYDELNSKIKIRIDKAKAGFLNVTTRVFNELKAQEMTL
jgi:hypothetical protein